MTQKLISWFMTRFFSLLYNQFAWGYDFVAGFVSFGEWKNWVASTLEHLEPKATLELGIGPGYLQKHLHNHHYPIFGLDISQNMTRLSNHRIKQSGFLPRLMQASSLTIPVASNSFQQVVCTFPSDYIFQSQTMSEINRILKPSGKLVILLAVSITGKSVLQRGLNLVYRLTGQSNARYDQTLKSLLAIFHQHQLDLQTLSIQQDFCSLTYLIGTKTD